MKTESQMDWKSDAEKSPPTLPSLETKDSKQAGFDLKEKMNESYDETKVHNAMDGDAACLDNNHMKDWEEGW